MSKQFWEQKGFSKAIKAISGKWKAPILYSLHSRTLRFGEIKKTIPEITHKILSQQLKELEADGLVTRTAFNEIPPRVEYCLTRHANELAPIMGELCKWGDKLNSPDS